ncbi:MAG TPA: hypothetical protein VKU80_11600 [Planctomycetota bacterium]|nr:hypothetical protein [Planctomycetota bacterium]
MAKYVRSGNVGLVGILLVSALALVSGALSGVAFHLAGRYFYIVGIFPLLWGLLVGAGTAYGVRQGKCRSALIGAAAGLVAGASSYGLFQVLGNLHHRELVRAAWSGKASSDQDLDRWYDEGLSKSFGGTGFWAQLSLRAQAGISLRSHGSSGNGKSPTLTGIGVFLYWLAELAVVAGIALALPMAAAKEPFCEPCEAWYEKKDLIGIRRASLEEARSRLAAGDYSGLAACFTPDRQDGILSLEKCSRGCNGQVRVKLTAIVRDKRGKTVSRKTAFEDMVTPELAETLQRAAAGPGAPPPGGIGGAVPPFAT